MPARRPDGTYELDIYGNYDSEHEAEVTELFLGYAQSFMDYYYSAILKYRDESGLTLEPQTVAQETWDMLRDGSFETP